MPDTPSSWLRSPALAGIPVITRPSPNHGARPHRRDAAVGLGAEPVIDMLVLHYTGMRSAKDALERMIDPQAQVSAHYMVDEDGTVFHLVDEGERAWHAGISQWRGQGDINSRSIGVEIVNPGHEFGYRPFPEAQMAAVVALCQDILRRHPTITADGVVGHADIAPDRKEDPGEFFDWPRLARAGVGLFPSPHHIAHAPQDGDPAALLQEIGYPLGGVNGVEKALIAFQRRYRPWCLDGQPDRQTRQTLAAVAALLEAGRGAGWLDPLQSMKPKDEGR